MSANAAFEDKHFIRPVVSRMLAFPRTGGCLVATMLLAGALAAEEPAREWNFRNIGGRIEASRGKIAIFGWQDKPLSNPAGGAKFAASAFVNPLRTPSGFNCTSIQPADHLHHFGLWWPWKYIETGGRKYNCWEIQEGQGAHVATTVKTLQEAPDPVWELNNETIVKREGFAAVAAIRETARVALSIRGDATLLDLHIKQHVADAPVEIVEYRYSGFTWRGPESWNKGNSTLITSEGKDRDHANGSAARWVLFTGPAPGGSASVLMMSAAAKVAGTPENLRVWDSSNHDGAPFVNFNPVMEKPLPLDDAHPAVSNRKYRVIAADHLIDASAAEAEWLEWIHSSRMPR